MAGEIASAYVRIRPNLSGFKSETTAGVTAGMKGALAGVKEQVAATAQANVAAAQQELAANERLVASYQQIAGAAQLGSKEQIIASQLAADAQRRVAAQVGETAAATRAGGGGFRSFGHDAKAAEKEIDRFGRGVLAGTGLVKGLGRSLAFASGGFLAFAALGTTVKDSLHAAGAIQKTQEVIRQEFGKSGEALIEFADKSGTSLGSLNDATLGTSAKLGILFKNMGFGEAQAAMMTKGWEKLGLAFNAVQGGGAEGAAAVLQKLSISATGASTRGLRQLGISLQSSTLQAKAFSEGITASVTQALTPGQKALVTYQLAMEHMPQLLALARAHSHDFANVQARLTAEWGKAKEVLGAALLPEMTRAATSLTVWLNRMERSGKLQSDFNGIVRVSTSVVKGIVSAVRVGLSIWSAFTHAVGGTSTALKILLGLFIASKFAAIAGEVRKLAGVFTGPLIGAVTRFKAVQAESAAAAANAARESEAQWAAAASRIKAMQESMGTPVSPRGGGAPVAAGVRPGVRSINGAGVARAAATVKAETSGMQAAFKSFATHADADMANVAAVMQGEARKGGGALSAAMRASAATTKATSFASRFSFTAMGASMKATAISVGATIKGALVSTGIGALMVAIGIAAAYVLTHWDQVKRYTIALAEAVIATWRGLKTTLLGIAEVIGGSLATSLTAPLRAFLEVASKVTGWLSFLPGVSGLHDKVNSALDFLKKGTTDLVTKGAHNVANGVTSIFNDASKAWSEALKKHGNDPSSKDTAKKAGLLLGQSMGQGAADGIAGAAPALSKTLSDTLRNAVQTAHQKIEESVKSAKNNLDKIGQDLAKSIEQIQQKIGGAAGSIAGSPQGQAFAKLRKLIESGAPAYQIQKAQAELSSQLQDTGKSQASNIKTQLANLTAAFDKGQIGYRTFESRLHKILHENGITLKEALKSGGPAFADAFKAQVRALGQQARAIGAIPAKFRGIGGAGGDSNIKIIRPLEVIRDEQRRIAVIASKVQAAQLKEAQKQTAYQQKMADALGVASVGVSNGQRDLAAAHHHHVRALRDHAGSIHHHATAVAAAAAQRSRPSHSQSPARGQRGSDGGGRVGALLEAFARLRTPLEQLRSEGLRIGVGAAIQRQTEIHALHHVAAMVGSAGRDICADLAKLLPPLAALHAEFGKGRGHSGGLDQHVARLLRPLELIQSEDLHIQHLIQAQRADVLHGLGKVAASVGQGDRSIVAAEHRAVQPIQQLRRDTLRIASQSERTARQQLRVSERTNALLRQIRKTNVNPLPGYDKTPKGKGSHDARVAARAGVQA